LNLIQIWLNKAQISTFTFNIAADSFGVCCCGYAQVKYRSRSLTDRLSRSEHVSPCQLIYSDSV